MISGHNCNATIRTIASLSLALKRLHLGDALMRQRTAIFLDYTPNTNYPEACVNGTDGNHPRYNRIMRSTAKEIGLYAMQSSFYVDECYPLSGISQFAILEITDGKGVQPIFASFSFLSPPRCVFLFALGK